MTPSQAAEVAPTVATTNEDDEEGDEPGGYDGTGGYVAACGMLRVDADADVSTHTGKHSMPLHYSVGP